MDFFSFAIVENGSAKKIYVVVSVHCYRSLANDDDFLFGEPRKCEKGPLVALRYEVKRRIFCASHYKRLLTPSVLMAAPT